LYNAHTGEIFDGLYRDSDGVVSSAAADLSTFLRDHHSGVAASMDISVIDFLWDVLNAVGATTATILSAYRTPETNAMLARTTFGVAEHSLHMYARAIDFTIGSALADTMAAARGMQRGGVGWYPRSHFIHIDSGPVRNWDLGDANLENLLINPASATQQNMRTAALTRRGSRTAPSQPPRSSQYASEGASDTLIRPSPYSALGSKDVSIRPSPYSGDPWALLISPAAVASPQESAQQYHAGNDQFGWQHMTPHKPSDHEEPHRGKDAEIEPNQMFLHLANSASATGRDPVCHCEKLNEVAE
jgi:uncharacterized protein YcbK (DUF882 family)